MSDINKKKTDDSGVFTVLVILGVLSMLILGTYGMSQITWDIKQDIQMKEVQERTQEMLVFRENVEQGKYDCETLKHFYAKSYPDKYSGRPNMEWHDEYEDAFVGQDCIDKDHLNNLIHIEICTDLATTTCEISRLENPELYENFDFNEALDYNPQDHIGTRR